MALWGGSLTTALGGPAVTVFEKTTVYHHIRVVDQEDLRTLSFDDSTQSRVSLRDPTRGHCEYTEYFHLPWLWNARLTNVLMIGLGGGSTQRAYARLYPEVTVETVEIDPVVAEVARQYFGFKETPRQRVHLADGRVFLRRATDRYDAILLDAYVQGRYGAAIPHHLATKEFFALAAERLRTNGVLAYNVIGTMRGWRADLLGAISKTMKSVFPQVCFFPVRESDNVIVVGSKADEQLTAGLAQARAAAWLRSRGATPAGFLSRVNTFQVEPPVNFDRCPVLTDDYAPVEGLSRIGVSQ